MSTSATAAAATPELFVAALRTSGAPIRLGGENEPVITIRVQVAEAWDAVRIDAPSNTPVSVVKQRALEVLGPDVQHPEDFVAKLRGWEVLNESASLAEAGAVHGSIFLLHHRRRRPVR